MSKKDVFAQEFRHLLAGIPKKTSLAQWQHMYRQAIIEMGLAIGERFKDEAARVERGNPIEDAASGGYHGPGPRYVLHLADYALSIGERFR
jgi:hypothetical protein